MRPLTTVHRRIGSIFIASKVPDAYSEDEARFLSLVADQMALAIDDALNFEASRTAQEQLKLLLDLTNSVVSTLDLRELLRSVSGNPRRVMSCDLAAVGVPDPENDKHLRVYALDFPDSVGFVREEVQIPIEGTPPGTAFTTGEPIVGMVRDLCNMISDSPPIAEGMKTGCVIPLVSRGRTHGVLLLGRRDDKSFSRENIAFLMQVAGQVAIALENALAYKKIAELKEKLTHEKLYLEDEIRTELNFEEIVGKSATLQRVLQQVATVAPTGSTVLIYGETGTGKELIARAIHNLSSRQSGAFVKLNCAAIPSWDCLKASCSATKRERLPVPSRSASVALNLPTAERYSSMKSARFLWNCSLNFSVCCRSRNSSALGARTLKTNARLIISGLEIATWLLWWTSRRFVPTCLSLERVSGSRGIRKDTVRKTSFARLASFSPCHHFP